MMMMNDQEMNITCKIEEVINESVFEMIGIWKSKGFIGSARVFQENFKYLAGYATTQSNSKLI